MSNIGLALTFVFHKRLTIGPNTGSWANGELGPKWLFLLLRVSSFVYFILFNFILSKRLQKKRRHMLAESSVKIYVDEQNIHCDLIFLHVSL